MAVNPSSLFKLGRLVPERRPLVVERANLLKKSEDEPETTEQIVYGYAYGPTTPGLIKAELAAIHDRYQEATHDQAGTYRRNRPAWHTYLRESIQALVPALTPDEVDVLAGEDDFGDDGTGTLLLRHLGYWSATSSEASPPGDPHPEVVGGGSGSSESSPTSVAPLAEPAPVSGSESPSV